MSTLTAFDKFVQQALKYGFSLFGIPKTGQTIKYLTGDDGDLEKGYPTLLPRFTDNGDGTITDNGTGLMWPKDAHGAGCNDGATAEHSAALVFANGLTFAGHSDWRLPNVKELMSIVDYGRSSPSIDPLFINAESDDYWSSTTYKLISIYAWHLYFINGSVTYSEKTDELFVRAVRGGR